MALRVLIVDDHAMVRTGLRLLIQTQPDLKVVGEASTLHGALELLKPPNNCEPDVITLDLSLPGVSGCAGVQTLRQAAPRAAVLVVTMHDDAAYIRAALAFGARGYVVKSAADNELLGAIRAVGSGRVFVDSSAADATQAIIGEGAGAPSGGLGSLSERERQVLGEVAMGYTNQQIADRAGLSVKTVESYRSRLMHKLNLRTRADLTRVALDAGVITTPATPHG